MAAKKVAVNEIGPILTVGELSQYMRVHASTIYRLLNSPDNKLPAFKIGSDWRFKREAIDSWIAKQSR